MKLFHLIDVGKLFFGTKKAIIKQAYNLIISIDYMCSTNLDGYNYLSLYQPVRGKVGNNMIGFSVPELLVILGIALVVFGPGKLPEVGKAVGKSIQEFKKAMTIEESPKQVNVSKDKIKDEEQQS